MAYPKSLGRVLQMMRILLWFQAASAPQAKTTSCSNDRGWKSDSNTTEIPRMSLTFLSSMAREVDCRSSLRDLILNQALTATEILRAFQAAADGADYGAEASVNNIFLFLTCSLTFFCVSVHPLHNKFAPPLYLSLVPKIPTSEKQR